VVAPATSAEVIGVVAAHRASPRGSHDSPGRPEPQVLAVIGEAPEAVQTTTREPAWIRTIPAHVAGMTRGHILRRDMAYDLGGANLPEYEPHAGRSRVGGYGECGRLLWLMFMVGPISGGSGTAESRPFRRAVARRLHPGEQSCLLSGVVGVPASVCGSVRPRHLIAQPPKHPGIAPTGGRFDATTVHGLGSSAEPLGFVL
jgi:hypothetical protein